MRKLVLLLGLFLLGLWFALTNFPGLAGRGEFESLIVNFRDDIPTSIISDQLETLTQQYQQTATLNSIFSIDERLYIIKGDRQFLKLLRQSPLKQNLEYVEPNYIYQSLKAPNDPEYSKQWNFRSINLEQAWESNSGQGVTVAVIDTGISRVPDLQQTEFVGGYDFVNDRAEVRDDNGHGTHIAGTLAQSTNNSYGVAGIAYSAKLMPLKVLSASGSGTVADIAEAIRFAADKGAAVINLSLGGAGESRFLKDAIDYAYNKGVAIVAAAGNSNQNAASYPARYPHVIGVAAFDAAGQKAPYSNYGAGVDIAAPGGSETGKILQETVNPQTGEPAFVGFQGTSSAAPHVAGVAALIKAAGVEKPAAVLGILQQSVRQVAEDPFNYFGAGQLDAGAAVQLAKQGEISFRDFFRWLRDNGYLNPRFWFDGGAVAVLPKILMVVGAYLLACFLRAYFPFRWGWLCNGGLLFGSCGLFFFRGLYIFDLPQWPFRLLGSSLPELGNVPQGGLLLNPFFASAFIPFLLFVLLWGNSQGKGFAIGIALGMAACLVVSAVLFPAVWGLGEGEVARVFLGINALLCFVLAYFASKSEAK